MFWNRRTTKSNEYAIEITRNFIDEQAPFTTTYHHDIRTLAESLSKLPNHTAKQQLELVKDMLKEARMNPSANLSRTISIQHHPDIQKFHEYVIKPMSREISKQNAERDIEPHDEKLIYGRADGKSWGELVKGKERNPDISKIRDNIKQRIEVRKALGGIANELGFESEDIRSAMREMGHSPNDIEIAWQQLTPEEQSLGGARDFSERVKPAPSWLERERLRALEQDREIDR